MFPLMSSPADFEPGPGRGSRKRDPKEPEEGEPGPRKGSRKHDAVDDDTEPGPRRGSSKIDETEEVEPKRGSRKYDRIKLDKDPTPERYDDENPLTLPPTTAGPSTTTALPYPYSRLNPIIGGDWMQGRATSTTTTTSTAAPSVATPAAAAHPDSDHKEEQESAMLTTEAAAAATTTEEAGKANAPLLNLFRTDDKKDAGAGRRSIFPNVLGRDGAHTTPSPGAAAAKATQAPALPALMRKLG